MISCPQGYWCFGYQEGNYTWEELNHGLVDESPQLLIILFNAAVKAPYNSVFEKAYRTL
jgi:hypothetical protein